MAAQPPPLQRGCRAQQDGGDRADRAQQVQRAGRVAPQRIGGDYGGPVDGGARRRLALIAHGAQHQVRQQAM